MKIAILSGKGGTGKTTVSTNLAKIMEMNYVDCDVEEPNGHIFLKPQVLKNEEVCISVPSIDSDLCNLCGACVKVCQFNALAKTISSIMFFDELCHGCGACSIVCKVGAIKEVNHAIGILSTGTFGKMTFLSGKLNIKDPMAGPIITALKKDIPEEGDTLIDCAPGSSCNVVKALDDTDYAILVTEPTKFGLHDLRLAVSLVRDMKIPFSVLINRSDESIRMVKDYCEAESIKLLGEIPFSRTAAEQYSKGLMLIDDISFRDCFFNIASNLKIHMNDLKREVGAGCK